MSDDRLPCVVPFCRRTAARERYPGASEWICGKHWPQTRARLRRLYRRAVARFKREPSERGHRRCLRLWEALKAEAMQP